MGCNPILGATLFFSIDFKETYVASIITTLTLRWRWRFALTLTLSVNGPFLVCLHCQSPWQTQRLIKNGSCRSVWKCEHCWETDHCRIPLVSVGHFIGVCIGLGLNIIVCGVIINEKCRHFWWLCDLVLELVQGIQSQSAFQWPRNWEWNLALDGGYHFIVE